MTARAGAVLLAVVLAACGTAGPAAVPSPAPSPAPVVTLAPTPTPSPSPIATPRADLPAGVEIHAADPANGVPLGYISYVPPGATGPSPLLLFLHGSGESGRGTVLALKLLFRTGITNLISTHSWPADRPFIVLAPQHDDTVIPCFTPEEIDGFLQRAMATYDIDPKRVYVTGLSCGAIGAWNYLGEHTNTLVAATVLIAGDGRDAFVRAGCNLGLVPVWAFHGALDRTVDPAGSIDTIAALKACRKPVAVDARITVYQNQGHNVWDRVYGNWDGNVDIYAWLLGHVHA